MGFRDGAYARIWNFEDKGNYAICKLTVSKKNKTTNKYEREFSDGFVRLVGSAYQTIKNIGTIDETKGINVKIASCDTTNCYAGEDGKLVYLKAPRHTVYGFEDANGTDDGKKKAKKPSADFVNVPDDADGDELPFS